MRPNHDTRTRCYTALTVVCCLIVYAQPQTLADDSPVSRTHLPACDDASTDPWVTDLREHILASDGLAHYAVEQFGDPVACHGRVDNVFDGMKFGTLELGFTDDVLLVVDTMPLETSRVTLLAPHGFGDQNEARQRLQDYVSGIGVEIDWSQSETTTENADMALKFWADDPGLNASAELVFTDGQLRILRFSMAL